MENGKIKKILEEIKTSSRAAEILDRVKKTEAAERVDACVSVARELGYDLTKEALNAYLREAVAERKIKTDRQASDLETIVDEDLDLVAGGRNVYEVRHNDACDETVGVWYETVTCQDTFVQKENCMNLDACDKSITMYTNYLCNHNDAGTHCGSTANADCDAWFF